MFASILEAYGEGYKLLPRDCKEQNASDTGANIMSQSAVEVARLHFKS
jgi:hypothetical protein